MESVATETVSLKVDDGTEMNAYVARPSGDGKYPGVLVFQEAFGVNAHIRDVTERLAREGYVSIAPDLYHRTAPGFEGKYDDFQSVFQHMKAMTEKGTVENIRAAHAWLTRSSRVMPHKIASIGFCMGGRASFLAATSLPLQASISFYGGEKAPALRPPAADVAAPPLAFFGAVSTNTSAQTRRALSWKNANAWAKPT